MMKKLKNNGFTVIEVVIAISILAVVGLLMYTFLGQGFSLYSKETASAEQQADIREVLSEITNKTRLTPKDSISYNAGVLTIADYDYAYDGERIIRNSQELATNITAFSVDITSDILNIVIANNAGAQISTSLSLME